MTRSRHVRPFNLAGSRMKKMFKLILILLIAIPVLLLLAGQAGMLRGTRPSDIGVNNRLLKAPGAHSQNVVSTQAALHPHTDYHTIAPLKLHESPAAGAPAAGAPAAEFARLQKIVAGMPGSQIITSRPDYFHAEFETKMLKFIDDVEFLLDAEKGEIHMRSASRIGRKDFGVNRARLEQIRSAFDAK